jgi:hypothetical protein
MKNDKFILSTRAEKIRGKYEIPATSIRPAGTTNGKNSKKIAHQN